jgi:hypothetical protein
MREAFDIVTQWLLSFAKSDGVEKRVYCATSDTNASFRTESQSFLTRARLKLKRLPRQLRRWAHTNVWVRTTNVRPMPTNVE